MKRKTHKQCKNCFEIKKIDDFYENKFSPDGRYSFCRACLDLKAAARQQTDAAQPPQPGRCANCHLEKPPEQLIAHSQSTDSSDRWCEECRSLIEETVSSPPLAAEAAAVSGVNPPEPEPLEPPALEPPAAAEPEPKLENDPQAENPTLLAPEVQISPVPASVESGSRPPDESAEKKEPQIFVVEVYDPDEDLPEIEPELKSPPSISRTRKCNGCGKVEPVADSLKVVIPVHAWFCGDCEAKHVQRYVRKGSLIQDERGNIYKIHTVLNQTLVRGVIQYRDGTWGRKKVNIYGNWKTRKRKKIKYSFFTLK